MSAFTPSFSMVALAEMGDKTQLLSIILAARFRVFWPIVAGILVATLANHGVISLVGNHVGMLMNPQILNLAVAILFIAVGLWTLIPDDAPAEEKVSDASAFVASLMAFFLAEMGDKTQLATLTLAAQYSVFWPVVLGSTLGMMAANVPAVLFGENLLARIPLRLVRMLACAMFLAFGMVQMIQWYYFKG